MITLYHCVSARSFRPLWTLEELGLPYELKILPFPPRVLYKEYLKVNPLGTVPFFINGSVTMSESTAICQYLCALSAPNSLNVDINETDYGNYLNFLHFGEATLTFPQTLVLRYSRFEENNRRVPQVADDYARWFLARLKTLEVRLENSNYLCSNHFTAADISVGYALFLAEYLELDEKFTPAVKNYWLRLKAREGFVRAINAERLTALEQGISTVPAPLSIAST